VVASFVGSALEFYDFLLYGAMAALVFNKLFFPNFSPFMGTLAAFASFAVGFVARPLGSVLFGYWGDKIGRQKMLLLSLGLMGGASVCIGLLPNFSSIGLMAPIVLVCLRLIQGFALGGEWGGAALMLVESTPPGKRGLIGSSVQMGVPGGVILATIATYASSWISGSEFFPGVGVSRFLSACYLLPLGSGFDELCQRPRNFKI
jgi:MHS family shikimate/dehydroshikimate transporter-like MFS transporter